ncbi:MAG: ferrous iron transport protein B [Bacteroidetes bacterium]|nr:ferrous iron transport protein B [Bacteroidota bacterium]
MTLFDLVEGDKAVITKVKGRGAFRKRIMEMGFIPGKLIRVVKKAPLKDPVEYNIMGYNVSLRNSEASLIEVITEQEALALTDNQSVPESVPGEVWLNTQAVEKGRTIQVALVGNPNSGKTTLFNFASGSRERVGNYSGVTVDAKRAKVRLDGYTINLIDLPGTYSLSAYSPEELFVRNYILNDHPDIVLNVVDGSNLERNLYLTTQLIDMDIKVVMALNMFDELSESGARLDNEELGTLLGIPIVPTVSSKGKGIENLFKKIIDVFEDKDKTLRHIHINYGNILEKAINTIQKKIRVPENYFITDRISSRFLSIKLLEKDPDALSRLALCKNHLQVLDTSYNQIAVVEEDLNSDTESLLTDAKYGFIGGALKETLKPGPVLRVKRSEVIDIFFTHKLWGIPVFIFFMWLAFFTTFKIGDYPKHWIESLVDMATRLLDKSMAAGPLKDLLIQGILGGVGGVIVFIPNILLLFLFIALMEDTGYLARAVFIMDKAMHKIGLHGKSFIPLLMGFGCNVPAIMSTRIIESRRDRLLTMLINPFMSCSARLPVYILFISAFFTSYQGTILFLIYMTGILLAIGSALLFSKTMFKKTDVPFVMELPPYRVPTVRSLFKHMWDRGQQYLRKIGGVIMIASIIIWALGYYPKSSKLQQKFTLDSTQVSLLYHQQLQSLPDRPQKDRSALLMTYQADMQSLSMEYKKEAQQASYIGKIGRFIEPVMHPLGFDWKLSVAILTGIAGKEIVVGTMGVLLQADVNDNEHSVSLVKKLRDYTVPDGPDKGKKAYSRLVALAFMFFILIYFPCIAVIVTIRKESGHWKWALFTIMYTSVIAWLVAFLVYQGGSLLLNL